MKIKKIYSIIGANGRTKFIESFADHIIHFENVMVANSIDKEISDYKKYDFVILPLNVDDNTLQEIKNRNSSLEIMFSSKYSREVLDKFSGYFPEYYYTTESYLESFPDFKVYSMFPNFSESIFENYIILINQDNLNLNLNLNYCGRIYYFINQIENGNIIGIKEEQLKEMGDIFKYIIVDSDRSEGKIIKVPNTKEPVILNETTDTVLILNIKSVDQIINSGSIYNLEEFLKITGKKEGELVGFEDVIKLLESPEGLFKDAKGRKIVVVTKISNDYEYALKERLNGNLNKDKLHTLQKIKVFGRR